MKSFTYVCFILTLTFLTSFSSSVLAKDYNYISPEQMKKDMLSGKQSLIVDIQVEDEFAQHHLQGSFATFAYPVKSDADRTKLNKSVLNFQKTGKDIVIVCPRGKGGAKRCYDYMKSMGVPSEKLFILEKGMAGWPYKELVVSGSK